MKNDNRIEKVLINERKIKKAINKVAHWINQNFKDKNLVLVTILKGSIPFIGALIPKIKVDFTIDYISISSFKGERQAITEPEIINFLSSDVSGKDILLVEDIVDSGKTIKLVLDTLKKNKCNSCQLVTLLDKPKGRVVDLKPDYVCFNIDLEFVVGFGLDYKEKFRNLPYIGILKKEYIQKMEDNHE